MGYLPSIATTSLILLSILYCSVSRNPPLGTLNRKISVCFEQSFPKILNVFRKFSLSSSVHTLEYPNSSLILAWKKDFPSFPSFPTTHMTFLSHGLSKYCLKSICHPLHSMFFLSIFFPCNSSVFSATIISLSSPFSLYPCLYIILFNFPPSSIFRLNSFILADTLFSNSSSVQLICSSLFPTLSSVFPSCFFICLFKISPLIDLKQTSQVFV